MDFVDICYERARLKEYDGGDQAKHDFQTDMEQAFEMKDWPADVKSKIHWLAYERGHSAGYSDIITQYFDLCELTELCLESK